MNDSGNISSFDEWIAYVFDRPVDEDKAWYWKEDHPFSNQSKRPHGPQHTLRYLTRLFKGPRFLLERFSPAQISQALWFIAHSASSNHMYAVLNEQLPWADRRCCIESVYDLNKMLFAVACDDACSHVDTQPNPLNDACYMWWDIVPYGVEYIFPDDYHKTWADVPPGELHSGVKIDRKSLAKHREAHLTMLATMERILSLQSVACREHALHGLGHFHEHYPREVEYCIDTFLKTAHDLPRELVAYAHSAREGSVL